MLLATRTNVQLDGQGQGHHAPVKLQSLQVRRRDTG